MRKPTSQVGMFAAGLAVSACGEAVRPGRVRPTPAGIREQESPGFSRGECQEQFAPGRALSDSGVVLLSLVLGGAYLTLVVPLLLLVALGFAALLGAIIVYDGKSTWLEGLTLVGLYCILAVSFWWG